VYFTLRKTFWIYISIFITDLLLTLFLYCIIKLNPLEYDRILSYSVAAILISLAVKFSIFASVVKFFYFKRVILIKEIIGDFKKGRFLVHNDDINGDDDFASVLRELVIIGKHLDNLVSSQRNEIDTFHEFYRSLVFPISSYFCVLDDDEKAIYANEGFCKKFRFSLPDVIGKKVEELFYFVNASLKGGIRQAKSQKQPVILEKSHLLSINNISIIADIKISNLNVQGRNQVILIIDDVTNKIRKDYQISIMSQISESIKRDFEIERVLFTILTGVTSGSGLGFNRAMLFLDNGNGFLEGKMAVGPDSFEEAIDIWRSVPSFRNLSVSTANGIEDRGKFLLKKVLNSKFLLETDNAFSKCVKYQETIHVIDLHNNAELDKNIKDLMDVNEFVVVPIIAVNKALGIIVVDNKFNQVSISNESIELLAIFASQAALSIESYNSLVLVKKEMEKLVEREDAIIESEKMAAVGRIAAHIAHEIRNPLVTMGGYSQRIIDQSKTNSMNNEKINKAARIILKESERLEKVLSNVMDFTKPSKYIKEFNNINDVIYDTLELLKNLLLEKRIIVHTDLKKNLPLVKSDFNQMKQVVLNLLQNSIDVLLPGGRIEIITKNDKESVLLVVKDTGSGIDEEDPNIIFEPFYTTKVTGVGLGLANVKKIIKDHNGTIEVRNRENDGVEFILKLFFPT